jgi:hypothetical protein
MSAQGFFVVFLRIFCKVPGWSLKLDKRPFQLAIISLLFDAAELQGQ